MTNFSGNPFASRSDQGRRSALLTLAVIAVATFILVLIAPIVQVLLLFFVSVLIAVLLTSLSGLLSRYTPLSDQVALAVVIIAIIGLMILGGVLVAPNLEDQARELIDQLQSSLDQLQTRIAESELAQTLLDEAPDVDTMLPSASQFFTGFTGVITSVFGGLATVIVVLFVGIYLAIEPKKYVNGFLSLIPLTRRDRVREVLKQVAHALRMWLLSRAVAMLAVGTLVTIGLAIIGIPLALPLGILAGLFELIPNLGPILATIPALLIALPVGMNETLYVLLLFFVIYQIESYLITPLIERKAVQLPPALTVMVQVLLGVAVGFIGVILAAPLTAVGIVLVKMLYVEDILHDSTDIDPDDTASAEKEA